MVMHSTFNRVYGGSIPLTSMNGIWFSLVERYIWDVEVVGSNPAIPIMYGCIVQLVERLTVNQEVTGSSPVVPVTT